MMAADGESGTPLILVDAPEDLPAAADELRAQGWVVQEGLDLPDQTWNLSRLHLVCTGTIRIRGDVEAAVLAAARGAGVLVAVVDEAQRARLFADLDHVGAAGFWRRREQPLAALDCEQRRLLELLAEGSTLDQVAEALSYSRRTVNRRLAAIRATLGVRTTAEAISQLKRTHTG
jgi:DNA-binding CsgD family transcriptional regulator